MEVQLESNGHERGVLTRAEPALALPGRLTPTAYVLPEDLSYERWVSIGEAFQQMERSVLWWLGDWWLFGERRPYGAMASQAVRDAVQDATGRVYDTLRHAAYVAERFESGRRRPNLSWSHHFEVAPLEPSVADEWLGQAEAEGWSRDALRRHVREQQRQAQLAALAASGPQLLAEDRVRVEVSDCAALLARLEPGSVDAIITDPPYEGDALSLYADLAAGAARVLKPSGSLLVMTGQYYLPQIMAVMHPHLRYHWTLAYLTPGGEAPQIWPRHVNTFWKPLLWWVQGAYDPDLPWVGDVLQSDANDKRFHEWGQSESGMAAIVERFTAPSALVVDPFLGAGTTGVVAARLGRRFWGGDIDPERVRVAAVRLAEAMA